MIQQNPAWVANGMLAYIVTLEALSKVLVEESFHPNSSQTLKPNSTALDLGTGTGFLAACMADMVHHHSSHLLTCEVGPQGKVVTIEKNEKILERAKQNIFDNYRDLFDQILFIVGDAKSGDPTHAPFQTINVGSAVRGNVRSRNRY